MKNKKYLTALRRTQKQLKRASEQNQRQTKRIADFDWKWGIGMSDIKILDACCGSRLFWFDKNEEHTTFMD
ncbi:methyltransferase, partial [Streptococcus agalactiae]